MQRSSSMYPLPPIVESKRSVQPSITSAMEASGGSSTSEYSSDKLPPKASVQIAKPRLYCSTACDQCFRLKTRCMGERPICGRCQKTEATCTYSTGRVKRAKAKQKADNIVEGSVGIAANPTSSRQPSDQDDPGLPHHGRSILPDDQLSSHHRTVSELPGLNHQVLLNLGKDSQWWERSRGSTNSRTEVQQLVASSTIEARGELGFREDTFNSDNVSEMDTSHPVRRENLLKADVASLSSEYPKAFGNHLDMEFLADPMMEGLFGFMPDTDMPLSAMISTSTTSFQPPPDTLTPDQTPDIDQPNRGLLLGDTILGLLNNEVKSPQQPITSRLQFARRGLDLVSTCIERHGTMIRESSTSMALASIATLQLVLTCYHNIRLQIAQPDSLSAVSDFHIGAFQLEEGDMCNRVVEAIVCKELEACRDLTRRLRIWTNKLLSLQRADSIDMLSAFMYGVESRLNSHIFSTETSLPITETL